MSKAAVSPRKRAARRPSARRKAAAPASPRIQKSKTEIRAIERREPLRRRVLESLADAPVTPRVLAVTLDASRESISRVLRELKGDGLVEFTTDMADRRQKLYDLTLEGEVQLNRHRAYGTKVEPTDDLDRDETINFLGKSLERAILMRRQTNDLGEARDRLCAVIREAEKVDAYDLSVKAMSELTKTLRQLNEPKAAEGVIDRLAAISLGIEPDYDASLALPAAAHCRYELGRLGDHRGEGLPARAEHLRTAFSIYEQLARSGERDEKNAWLCQRAWSLVGLAANLRKQTQLERALLYALAAKQGFDEVEDDYGSASCWFIFGFCLRLLGRFNESFACFDNALEIADRNAYERLRADALMQMGDALRSLGNVEDARALLNEALEHSDRMDLVITQAFAYSALGAVEFQEGSLDGAQALLRQAQDIFDKWDHAQGKALNNRRCATVARTIATESSRPKFAPIEVWIQSAIVGYLDLKSPAGFAACQIETGRVGMLRKVRRVKPAVDSLNRLLADRASCKMIELDPWVPLLLDSFAKETEDAPLQEAARRVYEHAQDVLSERAEHSVRQLGAVLGEKDLQEDWSVVEGGVGDPLIAEMGGETRRNMVPIEEGQILGHEAVANGFFADQAVAT